MMPSRLQVARKMSSKVEQCLKGSGEIVCEEGGCLFDMEKISFSEPRQMFLKTLIFHPLIKRSLLLNIVWLS